MVLRVLAGSGDYFEGDGLDSVIGSRPKHMKESRETMGQNSLSLKRVSWQNMSATFIHSFDYSA